MKYTFTILMLVVSLIACRKPYYLASDFAERTKDHQLIAVLPVQIVTTGNLPKDLSPADIERIDSIESRTFMTAIYHEILNSSTKKKKLYIKVQSYATTLSILEEHNIDVKSSWEKDPAYLAEILGVDAVVQSRISKKRYISDLASFGITVGVSVVETIAGGILGPYIPNQIAKTNDVNVSFALINKEDASTLYSRAHFSTIDYRSQAKDVLRFGAWKFGKKFPYRKTKKTLAAE